MAVIFPGRLGRLPEGVRWRHMVAVSAVAGTGFTVSLFIAGLAFEEPYLAAAKLGILTASLLASVRGWPPCGRPAAAQREQKVLKSCFLPFRNLSSSSAKMAAILSRSERETLKAIYRLAGAPEASNGAHTGDLAHFLGVSPGTATATIKRLADRGLAEHKPYRGVLLTREGRAAAVAAIRRHRIAERFLSDMLGYPWNEADRLAATFEHELPQEVEERLYVALHRPSTCPHGFPIPEPAEADIPEMPPLYDLEPGDRAVVAVPGATDDDVVAFLDTLGLRPGVRIEVKEKHPFDGPLVLVVEGQQRTVGEKVARQVHVRKEGAPPVQTGSDGAALSERTEQTLP